jgi:transposase
VSAQIFQTALGISSPWFVADVVFDEAGKTLNINIDFQRGSRFRVPEVAGDHPVHDTVTKRYRHLNFFQHECFLHVRVPRVKLPDGSVRQVQPEWAGKLSGFTLLFEALVLLLAQQMPFRGVARVTGLSVHRVMAICERYVDLAVAQRDLSEVRQLAIDETSRARGHDYLMLAADAEQRAVIFVTEGKDAATVGELAEFMTAHGGDPAAIESCSIDMSKAFIKGVGDHLQNAQITFDKFHVIAQASRAVDLTRRAEQKHNTDLKGMRWKLLRDPGDLKAEARAELNGLLAQLTSLRTARAWLYREQLREILQRKQVHVVRRMLTQWCTNVMRSKVEPMKAVARMIRSHLDGITAWVQSRQTNGFLEALNGLFQAAKRKARGYKRLSTARTVIFLLAGKLDFRTINPHAHA